MQIEIKTFEELSKLELYELLKLRAEIFVVEQDCVYNDLDDRDQFGMHVIGRINNEIAAYARVLPVNIRFQEVSIGRVVVASKHRGRSLGKNIMQTCINYVYSDGNNDNIRISAQCYLKRFYSELGFEVVSEEYLEDNIPHIEMLYKGK
jgi:ElaA protein